MTLQPLVSIIVPSYNFANYIGATISNALNQNYANIEIIVIDDGSVDETKNIVLKHIEEDCRVKYYYQENQGLSAARNTGLEIADGQYIQFLDADDLLSKEKLQLQVEFLEQNNNIDISYTNAFYFEDKNPDVLYKKLSLQNKEWIPKLNGKSRFNTLRHLIKRNIMPVNSALIRNKVIREIGKFNTELKSLEDWDYWFRCATIFNFSYLISNHAYCLIRVHTTSMSQNKSKMIEAQALLRFFINSYITNSNLSWLEIFLLLKLNASRENKAKHNLEKIKGLI